MSVRVGINGFGRIGRNLFRAALANPDAGIEVVGVNDVVDSDTIAHLLKHDSVLGVLPQDVKVTGDGIAVDGQSFRKLEVLDPAELPWKDLGAQVVVESTGRFTARDDAAKHLKAGAKKVVISAPGDKSDVTVCMGVNHDQYDAKSHDVISNASCTTNCLAPLARILHDAFEVERGFMTTCHAYTSDQQLVDLATPSRKGKIDLRKIRAASLSIIPSSTGAAKAIGDVVPEVSGKLDGMAFRVPVPDGSITDFVAVVSKKATKEAVNDAFRKAAQSSRYQGILQYTDTPLVSMDIVGNPHSCVFSAPDTMVNGNLVKVLGWYDNEWGYSNRLVDLCAYLAEQGL